MGELDKRVKDALQTRLEDLVADNPMNQSEIAKAIGISSGSLSGYINANKEAGICNLVRIADYFNVSTDYLLGRTELSTTNENIKISCKTTGLSDEAINNICSLTYPDSTDSVASRMGISDIPVGITTRAEMLNGLLGDDILFDIFTELLDAFIQNYELDAKYKTLRNNSGDSKIPYVLALQDKEFLAFRAGRLTSRICDTLQEYGKDNTALHNAYEVMLDETKGMNNAE